MSQYHCFSFNILGDVTLSFLFALFFFFLWLILSFFLLVPEIYYYVLKCEFVIFFNIYIDRLIYNLMVVISFLTDNIWPVFPKLLLQPHSVCPVWNFTNITVKSIHYIYLLVNIRQEGHLGLVKCGFLLSIAYKA